jgi:23S rRNA (guanosine2251-2'-O)-methyltransferase
VSSKRERNDRNRAFSGRPKGPARGPEKPAGKSFGGQGARPTEPPRGGRGKVDSDHLLWGRHPVLAALANPARKGMGRLITTAERAAEIELGGLAPYGHRPEVMDGAEIARLLPPGAVHQGFVFKVAPLEGVSLVEMAEPAEGVIVMLDQITDPQNVGAIFRSAMAFGARGIVVQDRHSPALAGALAKAAVGATERLPHARVTNLSRALETLTDLGWRAVGLDGNTDVALADALDGSPTVLVMGSEGDGIRRLVAEHCEVLARIPMPGDFESLNVSSAAAVALYEATRRSGGGRNGPARLCPSPSLP